jgi:protein-disulfide isomerase
VSSDTIDACGVLRVFGTRSFYSIISRGTAPTNPEQKATIQSNAQLLFHSTHQMVLGNPNGRVTLVEFFDYNCGYCRRALADMQTLLRDDIDLRVVLKEFPILGSGSVAAARVSIAVRMQDAKKYLAFHRGLLSDKGQVDKSSALAIAREMGLDMRRLEQDLSSDEVTQTLEESAKLAGAVGINGTPGYVIGDAIIPGAVGVARLEESIALARSK